MKFSASNDVVENVIKIAIHFEKFPYRQVYVKDLTVRACVSKGMYLQSLTTVNS